MAAVTSAHPTGARTGEPTGLPTPARAMRDDDRLLRFSRQILLPRIGVEGQERLDAAHAVVMGLGGLGSPVAAYLVAAGVGRLTLVDFDQVEVSNLQRQILHGEADLGRPKVESARDSLRRLNSDCRIDTVDQRLEDEPLRQLFAGADVVLDGTDRFSSRAQINRVAVLSRTPLVSGAVIRFEGQLTTFEFRDPEAPCYHCLYGEG